MSSSWDYTELAARMMGLTEQEYEALKEGSSEYDKIDEMLRNKYRVSLDLFCNIVRDLLPMTMPQKTPTPGELKHAMGVFNEHGFRSIVNVNSKFIIESNAANEDAFLSKINDLKKLARGDVVTFNSGDRDIKMKMINDYYVACEWVENGQARTQLFPLMYLGSVN